MIPKIIHQVWEGRRDPLPDFYKQLSETWKEHHPDWQYEFWNGDRIEAFVEDNFPHLKDAYFNFKSGM
jgi:mannosyltransferase OCH1-like enzyme